MRSGGSRCRPRACTYSVTEEIDERIDAVRRAASSRSASPSPWRPGRLRGDEPFALSGDAIPTTAALVQGQQLHDDGPTPPAAAETATVSPSFTSMARTAAYAVQRPRRATRHLPAQSRRLSNQLARRTATWVAWLERLQERAHTSSPTENSPTPSPTDVTTPARSLPSPDGNGGGESGVERSGADRPSPGLMAAARTATTTSPGPGVGIGTSVT